MATTYTSPVYTYQFRITNSTPKEQAYIIKPPNMPSPVPLPANRTFPALYTCSLAPSASHTFTTEILSSSQGKPLNPDPRRLFEFSLSSPPSQAQLSTSNCQLTPFRSTPLPDQSNLHGDVQRRFLATEFGSADRFLARRGGLKRRLLRCKSGCWMGSELGLESME
jgi:hypothetical protein